MFECWRRSVFDEDAGAVRRLATLTASDELAKFQIAGRCADGLIGFIHVQLGVFGAVVHDQVDDHAASTAGAVTGAVNLIALNVTPLAARSPILPELVERILLVILRMLLPGGVGKVDAVSCFEIFFLQRREEFSGNALLGPEAIKPASRR